MFRIVTLVLLASGFLSQSQAADQESADHATSKYAGEERRLIKSLSEFDIEELKNGSGWGLAKAAELNGVPGPAHLLELRVEIGLSDSQIEQIQQLFDQMKAEAISTGHKLIEKEKLLEDRFRSDLPNSQELKELLNEIGEIRSDLRFVHLDTHLKTPEILSAKQISEYNELRGYSDADPCVNVPAGHPADMWKKHHNCE